MKTTTEWTSEMVMHYAADKHGLTGECQRLYPKSYLSSHVVPDEGRYVMEDDKARIVGSLVSHGLLERRERVIDVPADTDRFSMFSGMPAHTLVSAHYHLTETGRAAWLAGKSA